MLEDVAVTAADPGVLGHVDDAQGAAWGAYVAGVEELPPPLPEDPLRGPLALAHLGAAGDRLQVAQFGRRPVERAKSGLPGA